MASNWRDDAPDRCRLTGFPAIFTPWAYVQQSLTGNVQVKIQTSVHHKRTPAMKMQEFFFLLSLFGNWLSLKYESDSLLYTMDFTNPDDQFSGRGEVKNCLLVKS
jgi:hypothetical protein